MHCLIPNGSDIYSWLLTSQKLQNSRYT